MLQRKIDSIEEGTSPPNVSYNEGDQSPLKGEEAKILRIQWAMAMDYVPYYYDHLSEWLKIIFCGNFDKFQNSLRHLSDQDTQKLLSKRESLLNVSSLFHVIIGARTLYSDHLSIRMAQQLCNECLDVKTDHLKIVQIAQPEC